MFVLALPDTLLNGIALSNPSKKNVFIQVLLTDFCRLVNLFL